MQSKIEPNNIQTDDVACLQAASRVLDILISCFGYLPAILVAPSDKMRLAKAEAMDQSGPSSCLPAIDHPSPSDGNPPASPWCHCLPDVIMSWGCLDVASVF